MEHAKRIKRTPGHNKGGELATYKPAELARILGIARNGVYAALRSGKIPHIRIGRRFVIPRTAVTAWFASSLQLAVPPFIDADAAKEGIFKTTGS
jgi:excisionase family DNA binding protein